MSRKKSFRVEALGGVLIIVAVLALPAAGGAQSYEVLRPFSLDGEAPLSPLIQASDGSFYGTTPFGGIFNAGTVFKIDSSGNLIILHNFTGSDGGGPWGGLIQAADGNFYGTASGAFGFGNGTVFRIDSSGNLTTLHSFAGAPGEGAFPHGELIQAADGNFYGTTSLGGSGSCQYGCGTIYKIDSSGNLTTLHSFTSSAGDGQVPDSGLTQATDGSLYGTTLYGGNAGKGTVFKTDLVGNVTTLHSFTGSDGANPSASLIQATDGNFYGTTYYGGSSNQGTIFRIDPTGNLTKLYDFVGSDGAEPYSRLTQAADGNLYGTTGYGGTQNHGTAFKTDLSGNLTILHSFAGNDGSSPAALTQATDGNFYGATEGSGVRYGTIFKMDSSGNLTTLYRFSYYGGAEPWDSVIQAKDGNFYGTTLRGGAFDTGAVFRLDSSDNLTQLYSFTGYGDGAGVYANLVQGTDGSFYGTTSGGGSGSCDGGCGTVFKVDHSGSLTTLYSFVGSDGARPFGGLIQAADGNFYGATQSGGTFNAGTIFRIDSSGNLTTLHSFVGYPSEGASPSAALIQANDGNLYGTTAYGGLNHGTVFKLDPAGNLTTLHIFAGSDGSIPYSALVQGSDGSFYGTTGYGGAYGNGTAFTIDAAGNLTTLHNFGGNDGANPEAGLIQATDGNFYGTTFNGGANSYGAIFKMDPSGNVTTLHSFTGSDGANPFASLIQATDGSLYGTTSVGGSTGVGVIFRLAACSPAPTPVITVTECLPANAPGFIASVPGNAGDSYYWTLTGGTIDSGQGTSMISFTSGASGTLMSVGIVETNSSNCSGSALQNLQVDFADEPPSDPFYSFVCTVGRDRVTAGCGGGDFCPTASVTRAQMAVLLLRAEHGAGFLPPPCSGIFQDVSCPGGFAVDWIEELFNEGIAAGCSANPRKFCPDDPVTRAQMAVFLLTGKHGSGHQPPACTGIFQDVQCPGGFAVDWIEELYREGITAGCSANPPLFCPDDPNTRGQMAVFLVTTFNLQ